MNTPIKHFIENLDNIISDSEMDTQGEFLCNACRRSNGDEKEREQLVRNTGAKIKAILGEEAHSQFMDSVIKSGGTCTSRPEFCNRFEK